MAESSRDPNAPLVAFAVTVCVLISGMIGWYQGFQVGQESHQSRSADAYKNYSSQEISERCALILDVTAQLDCITDAIRNAREQQRAEQDLDAQQEMSYWAKWMLIVTVLMTVFTLFGVVFVWHTLVATQNMSRDTKDIGRKQVRAYLRCSKVTFKNEGQNATNDVFACWVKVENFGQSPALKFRISVIIEILDYSHQRCADPVEIHLQTGNSIGPQGTQGAGAMVGFNKGTADKIRTSHAFVRVTVVYVYEDVFGEVFEETTYHHTEGTLLDSGLTVSHFMSRIQKNEHK